MRSLVVRFACWLFGHELYVNRRDVDAVYCECGRRAVTGSLAAALGNPILGRVWKLTRRQA